MNREQTIAHLELHGWFVAGIGPYYLAHEDGRWVTGPRDLTSLRNHGQDDVGALRSENRKAWRYLSDKQLDALMDAMAETGWL